jgi:hypothetical protein
MTRTRLSRRLSPIAIFFAAVLLFALVPPSLLAGDRPPQATPTQAIFGWFKLTDVEESTEKAYSDVFGAANISGFLGTSIVVNGQIVLGSFATVQFSPLAARQPEVKSCIDHALAAANLMETQQLFGNPGGRNTQLNLRITGNITVNTGNTRMNPGDWTILQVNFVQSLVCKVNTLIP